MAVLEAKRQNGISCTWSGQILDDESVKYIWDFDWDELKKKGVEKLTGHIIAKRSYMTDAENDIIDVTLSDDCSIVEKTIFTVNLIRQPEVDFEYYLTPHYTSKIEKVSYEETLFAATEKTDAVLVIEGKKLHVNKSFLSFHSDFFTALFSSNFKEGQMTGIPIEEVTYDDFALVLSTIHPKQTFPTDKTSEKLLQLADRFLLPSVTHIVQHHLLEHSNLENVKLMLIADSYGMEILLEKCIRLMDTVEKAKKLERSAEFEKLSCETRSKLFQRLLKLV